MELKELILGLRGLILGLRGLILGLRGLILGLRGLILGLRGLIWGLRGASGGMYVRTYGRTDVWKFTPVSYRTSALWGRCPKSNGYNLRYRRKWLDGGVHCTTRDSTQILHTIKTGWTDLFWFVL